MEHLVEWPLFMAVIHNTTVQHIRLTLRHYYNNTEKLYATHSSQMTGTVTQSDRVGVRDLGPAKSQYAVFSSAH